MVTVIKKGSSLRDVRQAVKKHGGKRKKNELRRFCGVISMKKNPTSLQKQWRNEWE